MDLLKIPTEIAYQTQPVVMGHLITLDVNYCVHVQMEIRISLKEIKLAVLEIVDMQQHAILRIVEIVSAITMRLKIAALEIVEHLHQYVP